MSKKLWIKYIIILLIPMLLLGKNAKVQEFTSFQKVRTFTTQNKVGFCAIMKNYSYDPTDISKMASYIKIVPKHPMQLSWDYNELCLKGLKPSTEYTVTLYKNIALGKYLLDKDYTFTQKTLNYKPSLNFPEEGYILPTKGEISIPIESSNLREVSLSLYRINNRNLIRSINRYGLFRAINNYSLKDIEKTNGYLLWKKKFNIGEITLNEEQLTAIPLGGFLEKREAGVYILYAKMLDDKGDEIYDYDSKMQWFMISDIGLYTLKSDEGLTVITKTLSSAKPYNNVKLELISKNNEVLETVYSKEGEAFFPSTLLDGKKGLQAKAIYAYGKESDFSVLDLSRPAHDLSDRGVAGGEKIGAYGAFIYSNRDIFRPSEKVTFHALLREHLGDAKAGFSVAVKIFDARGEEVYTKQFISDALGHISDSLNLSASAITGKWRIELYTGAEEAIGSYSFLVEDFVPPKIKLEIEEKAEELLLKSKYLNGEVFPNASIEVNTIIRKSKMFSAKYNTYYFGDAKARFSNKYWDTLTFKTDEKGELVISSDIEQKYNTTFPLSAHIEVVLSELGGRPIRKSINKALNNREAYIGIKPLFDNASVDMESKPSFEVIYLKNRLLFAKSLEYEVIEEQTHWHWRSTTDSWEYYKTYSDAGVIVKGKIEALASEPLGLKLSKLDWGSYRLKIFDDNGTVSSYRFSSGYEESSTKSSPDRLPVAISKQSYRVGDILKVNIQSKFTGPIMVSIAHHNIVESKTLEAKAGKDLEVSFEVADSWGSSAYVLATAFRSQSKKLGANRAIGVVPFRIEHPEKVLNLRLEHPKKVTSNSIVSVKIISKEARASQTQLTLAGVDEGVLNLTSYKTPNPLEYFFGQQKLGIEIRDIYAQLIETKGTRGKFNVGAGDMAEVLSKDKSIQNKRKVVALFSDVVAFDENGVAEINLSIPDYQGALGLVAVAWNKKALGATQSSIVVKDTISIEYYMPSFISMGDSLETLLIIDFDKSLEAQKYVVDIYTTGGIKLNQESFEANGKDKFKESIQISADALEDASFRIEVSQEGKVIASKTFELSVRTPYPSTYVRKIARLEKAETLKPQTLINQSVWDNIHALSLNVSSKALLPISSLENELIDYRGRCAEQTTSRAMPWLFTTQDAQKKALIVSAIERLLTYQNIEGGFGLWQGSQVNMWLSAFVLDFLTRAKEAGYAVPQYTMKKGLDYLENTLNRWSDKSKKQEADVYALYVLARAGRILMSEIKYHTKKSSLISSSQSWGHLGVTLATIGEKDLAKKMFDRAIQSLNNNSSKGYYYSNYGGTLRNHASLVALMAEAKIDKRWEGLFAELALYTKKRDYFSTQELSTLLRASLIMNEASKGELKLLVNDKGYNSKETYTIKVNTLLDLPKITNKSAMSLWYDISFKATADAEYYSDKENNGFSISKEIYSLDGKKVELNNIAQNDRLVIVIEGKVERYMIENPLISDWLPSGFEIENPHLSGINILSTLKWLGKLSKVDNASYRIDRFEVALSQERLEDNRFKVAYIVRAVSRGKSILAPAKIEDMYQPSYRAFSPFVKEAINIKKKLEPIEPVAPIIGTLLEEDYLLVNQKPISTLAYYTIVELNILRNSIFAHGGLDFKVSNPMLHKKFLPYAWYLQSSTDSTQVYYSLSSLQKKNVQTLLAEEKARGGGLVLADFYRVNVLTLDKKLLEKYDKKSLGILRNSLFARYGRTFKEKKYTRIFSFMPWYKPTDITVSKIFDELMSQREKDNILLMIELEKAL